MMTSDGRLFYLIGASGAGKDSLIAYVRERLDENAGTLIAHRYITRPPDPLGENHIALSDAEFGLRLRQGCFAMHWHSHGLNYGIGSEIDLWLQKGLNVLVNGSRAYLAEAVKRYGDQLRPVLIRVDYEVLRGRLLKRGRESAQDIEERISLARKLDKLEHPRLVRIDNNAALELAGERLLYLLSGGEE